MPVECVDQWAHGPEAFGKRCYQAMRWNISAEPISDQSFRDHTVPVASTACAAEQMALSALLTSISGGYTA